MGPRGPLVEARVRSLAVLNSRSEGRTLRRSKRKLEKKQAAMMKMRKEKSAGLKG
jgi:hypothetical protein